MNPVFEELDREELYAVLYMEEGADIPYMTDGKPYKAGKDDLNRIKSFQDVVWVKFVQIKTTKQIIETWERA